MSHQGLHVFLSSFNSSWYIFVPSRLRAKPGSFQKKRILSQPWGLIEIFISTILGFSSKVPSRFPHFSTQSYHFRGFHLPKTIQDKVFKPEESCFQNNSSTPSSDLLTGAFSKFGVLSLPLSSAFNRFSSKKGHLWTPKIFHSFVKMTFLPLAPFSEKIKAISKLNFSYSSNFLD